MGSRFRSPGRPAEPDLIDLIGTVPLNGWPGGCPLVKDEHIRPDSSILSFVDINQILRISQIR